MTYSFQTENWNKTLQIFVPISVHTGPARHLSGTVRFRSRLKTCADRWSKTCEPCERECAIICPKKICLMPCKQGPNIKVCTF